MAQSTKGKLNYRCPECFKRDIDMDMFYDEKKKEYYCLKRRMNTIACGAASTVARTKF